MGVKKVQITVVIEDSKNSPKSNLQSKHGLAFFLVATINNEKVVIMMDTGPSQKKLAYNADELAIKLDDIDVIVLSHSHYDHTGGLMEALRQIKKNIPVVGHSTLFDPKLSLMPHLRTIGAPSRISDVEAAGGVPILVNGPVKIARGITTTGEIPRTTTFETTSGFWTTKSANFVEDAMLDDQALVIDVEDQGLVVVSGCAHSGIINTIKYAQKITGNNKVYGVLGGFHLISANNKRIKATVDALKDFDPMFVGPCHCTGKKAVKMIAESFGDRCRILHTGDPIEF